MNLIRRAMTAAAAASRRVAGDVVTYKRGSDLAVEIASAIQGRTRWTQRDKSGGQTIVESVDWIFAWSDLELTPAKFDTVEFVPVFGQLVVFQVLPFGSEGNVWRWSGPDRSTVRVFTKLLSDTGRVPG